MKLAAIIIDCARSTRLIACEKNDQSELTQLCSLYKYIYIATLNGRTGEGSANQ
jgi:hypothetical protein